jgi:hypothetical protein
MIDYMKETPKPPTFGKRKGPEGSSPATPRIPGPFSSQGRPLEAQGASVESDTEKGSQIIQGLRRAVEEQPAKLALVEHFENILGHMRTSTSRHEDDRDKINDLIEDINSALTRVERIGHILKFEDFFDSK